MPMGTVVEVEDGVSVFAAARGVGIMVETACGGKGTRGLNPCRLTKQSQPITLVGIFYLNLLLDLKRHNLLKKF